MMNLKDYVENLGKRIIFILVLIDLKKWGQGRYCICNESRNTNIECISETKAFWLT